jgi:hypothetical protein
MGLKRRIRDRAAAVRLAEAGELFDVRGHAETEQGALAGLCAAAESMIADGYQLTELVGFVAQTGEVRLMSRAVVQHIAQNGPVEARFTVPGPPPSGSLLVVTERDGAPHFQHLQVT